MKRFAAISILLAVEILIGFESRIVTVAELTGFFVGKLVAGAQTFTALGMLIGRHAVFLRTGRRASALGGRSSGARWILR
jgi:hypothetical protein